MATLLFVTSENAKIYSPLVLKYFFWAKPGTIKKRIRIDDSENQILDEKISDNLKHFNRLYWYYNYVENKLNKNLKSEMKEFTDNIHINLKKLLEGFNDIEIYCKNGPGTLEEDKIYTTSIENLV